VAEAAQIRGEQNCTYGKSGAYRWTYDGGTHVRRMYVQGVGVINHCRDQWNTYTLPEIEEYGPAWLQSGTSGAVGPCGTKNDQPWSGYPPWATIDASEVAYICWFEWP